MSVLRPKYRGEQHYILTIFCVRFPVQEVGAAAEADLKREAVIARENFIVAGRVIEIITPRKS